MNLYGSREEINESLKTIINELYAEESKGSKTETNPFTPQEAQTFCSWLYSRPLFETGESIAVRSLEIIRRFPEMIDIDFLCSEFMFYIDKTDLHINRSNPAAENIFYSLIETMACCTSYPVNENDFNESMKKIEKEVIEKIETINDKKLKLPEKSDEYLNLFYNQDTEYPEKGNELLMEILLAEKELRQFLFTGLGISVSYFIYFIAIDERGHFSPVVKQAAMLALNFNHDNYLWKKLKEMRSDLFTEKTATAPVIKDASVIEFTHSICKAMRILNEEYDYSLIKETAFAVLETMPNGRAFLHEYPLKITAKAGDDLLTFYRYSLIFKTMFAPPDGAAVKRYVKMEDHTAPNSRGLPAALFRTKEIALPFIHRESMRYMRIENEAEIRIRYLNWRSTYDEVNAAPLFVRAVTAEKARKLIETYMMFLEMYVQNEDMFTSQGGRSINREDIAFFLEKNFNLSALNADSLLSAKINLFFLEPVYSIFKPGNGDEETLAGINSYIESIYGKPLTKHEADEKARDTINKENERITAMNKTIDDKTGILFPLLTENTYKWERLYNILTEGYTRRNTLLFWEYRGVLKDIKERPQKPFYYQILKNSGKFIKNKMLNTVKAFEKDYKWFKKVRVWVYNYIYRKLDRTERKLDICGWTEQNGECLRKDRQCCISTIPCGYMSEKGCRVKALSCKFWLCSAAQAKAASHKNGRRFLEKRKRYNFWCQALNIPLKIRCSQLDSFDEKAKEIYVDITADNWYDSILKGA